MAIEVTHHWVLFGVLIPGFSLVISVMSRGNNLDDTGLLEEPAGKVAGESSVSSLESEGVSKSASAQINQDSRLPINSLDLLSPVLIAQGSSTTHKPNPDIIPSLQSADQRSLSSSLDRPLSSLSTTYNSLDLILIGRQMSFLSNVGGLGRMGHFDQVRVLAQSVDCAGRENDRSASEG